MTGVWGRGRGCDELGQLAPPALVEMGGLEVEETHLQGSQSRVPSPSCLAPRVPNWQRQEAPPTWGSLPWHGPDLFSSSEQLPLSAGQRGLAPTAVGRGLQPPSSSHTLSPNLGPCLSLPPPPPPQEEEIPELEIDVDELLDMESDDTRAARVKVREGLGSSRVRLEGLGVEGCLEALPLG